jgi:tRNA guanosine-2'-O-methyltransferase
MNPICPLKQLVKFALASLHSSADDFQKKIIPWSEIQYDEEIFREAILTQKPRQQFIVVASLIDKIPNLAGLARTAEIFNGMRALVDLIFSYCSCCS